MYKKILVPLDGSRLSEQALPHAKMIAMGCHVPEVILLRVLKPIDNTTVIAYLGEESIKKMNIQELESSEDYMKNLADELLKDGIATQTVITKGHPAHEILEFIDNHQIDLVIMSTHGLSGPSRWILGSVTDRIVKHSKVPVLAVRTG